MTQESRLAIVIDSTRAKPSADDLARSMKALDDAGVRVTATTNNVSHSVGQMANQTDAAARSLRRGLVAVFGGISAMSVIDIADEWGQMASRMRMATESTDEYERAQARMLVSANATYRNINETREAFIQLSPVLRQMGMSLNESMDAIDAFSGLMVTNAASADRGAAALRALSVSLQKGKMDADQWITIYSTLDSIVDTIADHSGMAAEEIRRLGASGKLSVSLIAEALAGQFEPIMAQVEEMPTTVRDAFQKVGNEFSEYIGTANEAAGVTAGLADGISFLGENLATVLNAGAIAGAGALAVYTSRTIGATAATVADTLAKRAAAAQELALAEAQAAETAATLAQTRAQLNLTATRAQLATATAANIAAEQRLAAARAGVAGAGRSLLGILGGPVGLLATVGLTAAAFIAMDGASDRAKIPLDKLTGSADEAAEAFRKLGTLSRQAALNSLAALQADQMREATVAMSRFVSAIEPTTARGAKAVAQMRSGMENELRLLVGNVMTSGEDLEQAVSGLIEKWVEQGAITRENASSIVALASAMSQSQGTVSQTAKRIAELVAKNDELNASARAAAGGIGTLNAALSQTDDAGRKYLERLTDQSITAGLKTQREQLDALVKAGKLVFSDADLKKARQAAGIIDAANPSRVPRSGAKSDPGADYLKDARERIALLGQETEYEQLLARISTGSLTFRTEKQRELAEELAKQFDATKKQIELEEVLRDLREQQSTTQMQLMRELDAFGQGDRVRQLNADLAKTEDRYRSIIDARRNSPMGLSDDDLAQIQESLQIELDMVRAFHDQKMVLMQDWGIGARDALINYADESANAYAAMSGVVSNAFKGMEDALTQFATTGKADFRSLANSIIADLIRIQIQKTILGPIAGFLGGGGGMAAMAGNAVGMFGGDSIGAMIPFLSSGMSSGGYTGDGGKYEPAGLVHKGEGVLSQEDIRALGGEAGFHRLRSALRRGHSQGGMGGQPSTAGSGGMGQGISLNFTVYANDADSFNRSRAQIERQMAMAASRAMARS